MRTKVLLCAAALAASLASSMAQNVYSLNVVGYVNVTVPANSFMALANPLDASKSLAGGNNITNLFKGNIGDSSTIAEWDPLGAGGAGDWKAPITYIGGVGWDAELTMPVGKGVLFFNNGPALPITFVGEVIQGPYPVETLTTAQFALVGAPAPLSGGAATVLIGLTPEDSDSVAKWDPAAAGGAGDWTAPDTWVGAWDPGALTITPGDAVLYFRNGPTVAWQSNFTVN